MPPFNVNVAGVAATLENWTLSPAVKAIYAASRSPASGRPSNAPGAAAASGSRSRARSLEFNPDLAGKVFQLAAALRRQSGFESGALHAGILPATTRGLDALPMCVRALLPSP